MHCQHPSDTCRSISGTKRRPQGSRFLPEELNLWHQPPPQGDIPGSTHSTAGPRGRRPHVRVLQPQVTPTSHHQRLTAEGDDVAAVLMHELPRHRLLHDLLHLSNRGPVRETGRFHPKTRVRRAVVVPPWGGGTGLGRERASSMNVVVP